MDFVSFIKNKIYQQFGGIVGRIISGTSWVLIGTLVSKVLVFVATIIVARILSKEVYGQLSIIRSTIQLFIAISAFGVGATATKFIAEYRKTNPSKAINIYFVANAFVWLMAIISCTILMICADSLAISRLHQPELAVQLRVAGVILFFTLLNGAQTGTLSGFEDFKRIAKCNAIMGCTEIVFLCTGAYFFGLTGAVIGFGLTYGIAWIYNSIGIRTHLLDFGLPLNEEFYKLKLSDFKVLFSFSLPIAATSWIQMLTYWWMKTAVVSNSGFENMANYDVAEQWKSLILMIPGMVASVILPILSNVGDNKNDKKRVVMTNLYINVGITGTLTLLLCFLGKWVLLLYGNLYTNVWPLYILAFSTIFDSLSSLCGTILVSSNKALYALFSNGVWAATLALSYMSLSKSLIDSENALALAYLIAATVQSLTIVTVIKIKKIV